MPQTRLKTPAITGACTPKEILVAIPALNEAAHLEQCLGSLIGGDSFMRAVRVVVADGGSQDGTPALVADLAVRYPALRLIRNPQKLQSAAINAAVSEMAASSHRILVRCDAHSIYPTGYVRAVADSLAARPEAAALVTPMDAAGSGCFQRAAAWIVDTPLGSGGSAHRGGHRSGWIDHGHHAGFKLDWFRQVGGYDESFSHNEDAELDHRLGLAGGKIWLDAHIRLAYTMRATPAALGRQYWNYGRGRARTVLKHRMRPRLRQMIPVINLLGLLAGGMLIPGFLAAALWPATYAAVVAAAGLVGALQLRSLCGFWAGPALAIMHNAWGAGFLVQVLFSLAARTPAAARERV
ncbi:glycosyltransferase family 2 protein (plasmid) [Leisingera sp. NJS201]|uniref:glycosyltransferase family 2 protein n=1 Tax=Leisingera sp. NJS201 TaxID=2508306 RepID=UPI00107126C5|nr:glycosyltransferase family 2 protein [Leisingera sp. NJS201]QBR38598.1 glycosyltransferase family 2 protein [Leisingera sp. NJS201]